MMLIFLGKSRSMYSFLREVKDFYVSSVVQPNLTKCRPNFAKIYLWSGPYKMPISVVLVRKS